MTKPKAVKKRGRTYLTAREIEIVTRFKDGWCTEALSDFFTPAQWPFETIRFEVEAAIRKAMKLNRWWIPQPRQSKRRDAK